MVPEYISNNSINKKLTNDLISQLISLLIIIAVVMYYIANKEWRSTSIFGFILIIGLVVILEAFLQIPAIKKRPTFSSNGPVPLVLYNLCILLAVIFYIPLYSPFIFAIATIIFITVYYKGIYSVFFSIINLIAIVIIYTIKYGYPNLPNSHIYPYLLIMVGTAFAGIVQRAGSMDAKIRKELSDTSLKIANDRLQLSSLINGINDSIIATDNEGKIIFYNSSLLKLMHVETVEINKPFSDLIKLYDDQSNLIDFFNIFVPELERQNIQNLHIIDSSNQKKYISIDISRVVSEKLNKQSAGAIILIRDITRQKSLDNERDEFMAVTSHELRTPIAIAEGSISVVLNNKLLEALPTELKDNIDNAHKSILELANLVNQLKDLSDIEKNNLQLQYEYIDPENILNEMKDRYIEDAKNKNIDFSIHFEKNIQKIYSSKAYLDMILESLLDNALRYTDKGSVTLGVHQSSNNPNMIIFSVRDSGMGISNSDKDRIFTKFYRAEDYTKKHTKGAGLGLYLTKKMTDAISGKIWFESELNKGSIFYLAIPMNQNK